MTATAPIIITYYCIISTGIFQSPSVQNGVIRVKIGTPVYTVDGFAVTIVCNVTDGDHPITISWLNNGEPDHSRTNMSVVTISNAAHGDVYTCIAKTNAGSVRKSTKIYFVHKKFCINM